MRKFNYKTLQKYDGENELEIYISYNGLVYDVTDCPKWRTGLHERLHFGGQDLTADLNDAPHHEEVFNHPCAKLVGTLEDNT